jgi:O-acetylhomoserine (thiol)-lyase
VNYPGLESHKEYKLTQKLMNGKASSVLSFGIKGGMKKGGVFIDNLNLITRLVNIGDAKSLACHPASTTHRQLSKKELKAAGVPEDLVRLSIGLENIDDIIEDLDKALKASQK